LQTVQAQKRVVVAALEIWERRRGETTDLPIAIEDFEDLVPDVAGVEIDWSVLEMRLEPARSLAAAVVLEAYGLLENLDANERAELVRDLLTVLERK